jgi:hypothetical protein
MHNGEFYTLFVVGSDRALQPLLISYPLTSGEVPDTQIWEPLPAESTEIELITVSEPLAPSSATTTTGPVSTATVAAMTNEAGVVQATGEQPAPILPVTGDEEAQEYSLPMWLLIDGFLLALVALAASWLRRALS